MLAGPAWRARHRLGRDGRVATCRAEKGWRFARSPPAGNSAPSCSSWAEAVDRGRHCPFSSRLQWRFPILPAVTLELQSHTLHVDSHFFVIALLPLPTPQSMLLTSS